jgi:acyl carrier protein
MASQYLSIEETSLIVRGQLGGKAARTAVIDGDSGLEQLGLTSLDVTEVFFALEERVDIELDPVPASDAKTLGDLVNVVNAQVRQALESAVGTTAT